MKRFIKYTVLVAIAGGAAAVIGAFAQALRGVYIDADFAHTSDPKPAHQGWMRGDSDGEALGARA